MAVVVPYFMTWVIKELQNPVSSSIMYDAKVAPTILDGGNELLLAEFSWTQITEM